MSEPNYLLVKVNLQPEQVVEIKQFTKAELRTHLYGDEVEGTAVLLLSEQPDKVIDLLLEDTFSSFSSYVDESGEEKASFSGFAQRLMPIKIDSETPLLSLHLRSALQDIARPDHSKIVKLLVYISASTRHGDQLSTSYCEKELESCLVTGDLDWMEIENAYQALASDGYLVENEQFMRRIEQGAHVYGQELDGYLAELKDNKLEGKEEALELRLQMLLKGINPEEDKTAAADIAVDFDSLRYIRLRLTQIMYQEPDHSLEERNRAQQCLHTLRTELNRFFDKDPLEFCVEFLISHTPGDEAYFSSLLLQRNMMGDETIAENLRAATKVDLYRNQALGYICEVVWRSGIGSPMARTLATMLKDGEVSNEELNNCVSDIVGPKASEAITEEILSKTKANAIPVLPIEAEQARQKSKLHSATELFLGREKHQLTYNAFKALQEMGLEFKPGKGQQLQARLETFLDDELTLEQTVELLQRFDDKLFQMSLVRQSNYRYLSEKLQQPYDDIAHVKPNQSFVLKQLLADCLLVNAASQSFPEKERELLYAHFIDFIKLAGHTTEFELTPDSGPDPASQLAFKRKEWSDVNKADEPTQPTFQYGEAPFTNIAAISYAKLFKALEAINPSLTLNSINKNLRSDMHHYGCHNLLTLEELTDSLLRHRGYVEEELHSGYAVVVTPHKERDAEALYGDEIDVVRDFLIWVVPQHKIWWRY